MLKREEKKAQRDSFMQTTQLTVIKYFEQFIIILFVLFCRKNYISKPMSKVNIFFVSLSYVHLIIYKRPLSAFSIEMKNHENNSEAPMKGLNGVESCMKIMLLQRGASVMHRRKKNNHKVNTRYKKK